MRKVFIRMCSGFGFRRMLGLVCLLHIVSPDLHPNCLQTIYQQTTKVEASMQRALC